jgi:hypothetical protein
VRIPSSSSVCIVSNAASKVCPVMRAPFVPDAPSRRGPRRVQSGTSRRTIASVAFWKRRSDSRVEHFPS